VSVGMLSLGTSPPSRFRPSSAIVDGFIRWDAGQYLRLVAPGYTPSIRSEPSFYPLYPLTGPRRGPCGADPVHRGGSRRFVGRTLAGSLGNHPLHLPCLPGDQGMEGRTAAGLFPASFFLLAGYAESMFVAFGAWTLVALAERRPWIAAPLQSQPLSFRSSSTSTDG
jgi:hypothetical protein